MNRGIRQLNAPSARDVHDSQEAAVTISDVGQQADACFSGELTQSADVGALRPQPVVGFCYRYWIAGSGKPGTRRRLDQEACLMSSITYVGGSVSFGRLRVLSVHSSNDSAVGASAIKRADQSDSYGASVGAT